jgi:hypothetical protein
MQWAGCNKIGGRIVPKHAERPGKSRVIATGSY